MTGKGEICNRKDGRWAFRVKAINGDTIATDGGRAASPECGGALRVQRPKTSSSLRSMASWRSGVIGGSV